jgi:polyketide biosynthesis 3-hydroxy-3-methylglutaryl-CoA synthase-like enzyme PksG
MSARVGIDRLNVFPGLASIEVADIFAARGLDPARADNLMMRRKTVGLPCEDAVTNAVNAARPVVDTLSEDERQSIDLLITATESGLDFGKSLATYVHRFLGLKSACRLFEVKQACYGGTAALQMAVAHLTANPGSRALVIATDVARPSVKLSYAEPSQGAAAVAMLVARDPTVFDIDPGASGIHAFEVADTCRPDAETETGDADLSLMSYLDCLEGAYGDYARKVDGADFRESFAAFAFHAPFAGMVKGAHRNLMRRLYKAKGPEIEADFAERLQNSLRYCTETGNAYSATVYVALAGLIDALDDDDPRRVGLFSYGSGCCSEFFSGIVPETARGMQARFGIASQVAGRRPLTIAEYDLLLELAARLPFGVRNATPAVDEIADMYGECIAGRGLLVLKSVEDFRRDYAWS